MNAKVKKELKSFLENWKLMNHEKMYELSQETWKGNYEKKTLKRMFPKRIKTYSLGAIKKIGEAHVSVKVIVGIGGVKKHLIIHLVCETAPFRPNIKGKWGVNPSSVTRNLY